jgi:hypothetical protein
MRLPGENASYEQLVRFGRYVTRRVRRKKLTSLAQDTENTTAKLQACGRAWDDAEGPYQDALADRDAADDDLDFFAKESRLQLASRSLDATKTSPYLDVFPQGVEYYTAAPLDEEVTRYSELSQRLDKHLAAKDPLRAKLTALIAAFRQADDEEKKAVNQVALAKTALDRAKAGWRSYIDKLHGALKSQFGKVIAEQFFPKAARGNKKTKEEPTAAV